MLATQWGGIGWTGFCAHLLCPPIVPTYCAHIVADVMRNAVPQHSLQYPRVLSLAPPQCVSAIIAQSSLLKIYERQLIRNFDKCPIQQLQSRFLINLCTYTHGEAIAGEGYKLRSLFSKTHLWRTFSAFLSPFHWALGFKVYKKSGGNTKKYLWHSLSCN